MVKAWGGADPATLFPENFRAVLLAPLLNSFLMCLEGAARLGVVLTWHRIPRLKKTSFCLRNMGSFSSHPYACVTGPPPKKDMWVGGWEGWGRGQVKMIGFDFDFFPSFLRLKVL